MFLRSRHRRRLTQSGSSAAAEGYKRQYPKDPKCAEPRNFEAWLAADDRRRASAQGVMQSEGALHMRDTAGNSAGPPGSAALKADEDDNDVRTIRAKARPKQPTNQEVDEHAASGHLPYRTWCRSFVAGRVKSNAHSVTVFPEHLDEVHTTEDLN